ncbi:MAG: hypothetical protein Salg2KO_14280 [Salibacteraceae bacterium]
MQRSGLILRIIPYSDSARIIKCLTDDEGLQAYFFRSSKKSKSAGHIQTGSFISFLLNDRPSKLPSIKECRPDPNFAGAPLPIEASGVWLFTLELLNKSLEENFHIPGLKRTVDRYYSFLAHDNVSTEPLTPLILISQQLGIWNRDNTLDASCLNTIEDFEKMGMDIGLKQSDRARDSFDEALTQFKNHFSIYTLDSLDLIS